MQYVVVVRVELDQNVEVLGPYRSKARAEAVRDRVSALEEVVQPWAGWTPTVEALWDNHSRFLKWLKERFKE